MIKAAVDSGFTHGKIQGLYSGELTYRNEFESPDSEFYRPFKVEYERLSKLDLSEADEKWFVQEAIFQGLIPMITVFTHAGVERAKNAGFKSIKIASYDCASAPIIKSAAEFAEELIVSTGATKWVDIAETAKLLLKIKEHGKYVALLHARTLYPTSPLDTGLAKMLLLKEFNLPVGFSDHSNSETSGLLASKFALLLGAEILERHFTILSKTETRDGHVSINPQEAFEIVKFDKLNLLDKFLSLGDYLYELGKYLHIKNLEPTRKEEINSRFYKGRVASKLNNQLVFSWEEKYTK